MSQHSDTHSQAIPSLPNACPSLQNANVADELRTHPITLESTASMDVPAMAVFAQRISMDLLRIPPVHESPTKAAGIALPAISCLPGSYLEAAPIELAPLGSSAFSQAERLHAWPHNHNRSTISISEERDAADTIRKHDSATGFFESAFKSAHNVQTRTLVMPDQAQQPPQSIADVIRALPDVTGQLIAEAESEVARADMLIAASEPSCAIPAAEGSHLSKGPLVLPRAAAGSASICPVSVTHEHPVPDPKALQVAIPSPGEASSGVVSRSTVRLRRQTASLQNIECAFQCQISSYCPRPMIKWNACVAV